MQQKRGRTSRKNASDCSFRRFHGCAHPEGPYRHERERRIPSPGQPLAMQTSPCRTFKKWSLDKALSAIFRGDRNISPTPTDEDGRERSMRHDPRSPREGGARRSQAGDGGNGRGRGKPCREGRHDRNAAPGPGTSGAERSREERMWEPRCEGRDCGDSASPRAASPNPDGRKRTKGVLGRGRRLTTRPRPGNFPCPYLLRGDSHSSGAWACMSSMMLLRSAAMRASSLTAWEDSSMAFAVSRAEFRM